MSKPILFGLKYSSCSWRVRAALHHKGILFEERSQSLVSISSEEYKKINPSQKVPALFIDGVALVESMAILQYLEETRPEPPLLPSTPLLRARMREIVETIVSGIQPLQNIGLKDRFETTEQYDAFSRHYTERGLQVLEEKLVETSGTYCVGDQLTMADLCLVPQVFNAAGRLKLNVEVFQTVFKLYSSLLKEPVIKISHPKSI